MVINKKPSFKKWFKKNHKQAFMKPKLPHRSSRGMEDPHLRHYYEEYLQHHGTELVLISNHYIDVYKIIEELGTLPPIVTWREIAPIFVFGDKGYRRNDFKSWYKIILDFTKKVDVKKLIKKIQYHQDMLIAGEAYFGMTWWSLSPRDRFDAECKFYEDTLKQCEVKKNNNQN